MTVNQRTGSPSTDANLDQLVANIDDGAVTLGGSARRVDVNVRRGDIRTRTPIAVTESFKVDTEYGGSQWSSVWRPALPKRSLTTT